MSTNATANWYAVCVRHQNEKRVERLLSELGWETLAPRYRGRRQWSDRVKEIELALFAGYVFCRFGAADRQQVEDTPGVMRIVSFAGTLAPIEAREMEQIRSLAGSRIPLAPWPYLKEGDRVRVQCGPLKGIEGTLLRTPDGARLIVGVELLQRAVACELDPDMVAPLRALGAQLGHRRAAMAPSMGRALKGIGTYAH